MTVMNGNKFYIIRCTCGHYKKLDDELCPECGADYSAGARFSVLPDQELANKRWDALGSEKAFNNYMAEIKKPVTMLCPNCKFEMIASETKCPKCGIGVRFVPLEERKPSFSVRFWGGMLNLATASVLIPIGLTILFVIVIVLLTIFMDFGII